jgi:hypothetical protein
MPIQFLTQRIDFPESTGETSPPVMVMGFDFGRPVVQATAVLAGFNLDFPKTDRPVHQVLIDVLARPQVTGQMSSIVEVEAFAFLRDFSGDAADPWEGFARVTVIAEVQ